jgi:hypothetical protein
MLPPEMPRRCWWVACLVLVALSCLPDDTRIPPSSLTVTASSDELLQRGILASATADGWAITYDQFLICLGRGSVEGGSCKAYSDLDYSRVLEARTPGSQELGVIYARGQCSFDFELSSPHADTLLGAGVVEGDKTFMRTPATDAYAAEAGVSIYVAGRATKDGSEKRFAWPYRYRIDYSTCGAPVNGVMAYGFDLPVNGAATAELRIRGGTLFQNQLDEANATLGFGVIADADSVYGDNDGEVSLAELGLVPLADVATADWYADADADWKTLEDYLYLGLFSQVVRYHGDGTCEQEEFPNDRTIR